MIYNKNKVTPRGKSSGTLFTDINWEKAWLAWFAWPRKLEVHLKLLQSIYPVNIILAKFMNISKISIISQINRTSIFQLSVHCSLLG